MDSKTLWLYTQNSRCPWSMYVSLAILYMSYFTNTQNEAQKKENWYSDFNSPPKWSICTISWVCTLTLETSDVENCKICVFLPIKIITPIKVVLGVLMILGVLGHGVTMMHILRSDNKKNEGKHWKELFYANQYCDMVIPPTLRFF